jgi:hypothetical protein
MKLDRKALNRLLSMSDKQLKTVIEKLTREYGVDLSQMNVSTADMAGLRRKLQSTTDEELVRIAEQLRKGK